MRLGHGPKKLYSLFDLLPRSKRWRVIFLLCFTLPRLNRPLLCQGDVERDQNLRGDAETSDPSPPSPHLSDTTDLSENNSDVELNLSSVS